MSGVAAHIKLQQMIHIDAGFIVNKAVFDQLGSDGKRAALMHEQVRASPPEAEAWRQLLQAEGGHCAGQALSPSQRAGQAPGPLPCPVQPKVTDASNVSITVQHLMPAKGTYVWRNTQLVSVQQQPPSTPLLVHDTDETCSGDLSGPQLGSSDRPAGSRSAPPAEADQPHLNNACRTTQWWLALIKPHLQHLAAASSARTSLEANLKHITVTLATWDAVWEVYLDPKWARQRLRLYGAQDRALEQFFKTLEEDMAEVAMEHHGRAKQLVVFFGAAGIGTGGGWGADAVLRACCKVVCRPRGIDQLRGRVVLVDEPCTTRVSSTVIGQQPCGSLVNKRRATRPANWKPPAGQVDHRFLCPAWSQQRDQPVRGLMWCPVVTPRILLQAATQPAASELGPSTPRPANRSKRIKAEQAAEPTQPTKGTGKGKGMAAEANPAPQPGRLVHAGHANPGF
ncbi:hypothetical protein QJQ45_000626 [Haematococcus lacustris]|nr:hypothetical protein QJQ45_000626 [Haematococcus lacustris]